MVTYGYGSLTTDRREAKKPGEAAASVEHAGRLFEGWVHRRQQLADVPWKKRQDGPGGI